MHEVFDEFLKTFLAKFYYTLYTPPPLQVQLI